MKNAFAKLEGDLAGNYYALTGMDEAVRQQLVDDHFLFMSGDPNLKVAGTPGNKVVQKSSLYLSLPDVSLSGYIFWPL